MLVPKSDTVTMTDMRASEQAAAQDALTKVWGGTRPPILTSVIHDGDSVRPSGEPFGKECRGHWVITASSKEKPEVVGIDNVNVQLAPKDIYSGMWARVTLNFYGYSHSGNKGVGCGLQNVMKTRDDEPLSGRSSAASDFATVGNAVVSPKPGTGAAAVPAPQTGLVVNPPVYTPPQTGLAPVYSPPPPVYSPAPFYAPPAAYAPTPVPTYAPQTAPAYPHNPWALGPAPGSIPAPVNA